MRAIITPILHRTVVTDSQISSLFLVLALAFLLLVEIVKEWSSITTVLKVRFVLAIGSCNCITIFG